MEMNITKLKMAIVSELTRSRVAQAQEIANAIDMPLKEIGKALRALREDGAVHMGAQGYYSLKEDHRAGRIPTDPKQIKKEKSALAAMTAANDPFFKTNISKQAEPAAKSVSSLNEQAGASAGACAVKPRRDSVHKALAELESNLKVNVPEVSDKQLKTMVLNRLAELLSSDIGDVLQSIAADLEALPEAAE